MESNIYFINVFVAKLGSTAGKFPILKERGGRGERERQRERKKERDKERDRERKREKDRERET